MLQPSDTYVIILLIRYTYSNLLGNLRKIYQIWISTQLSLSFVLHGTCGISLNYFQKFEIFTIYTEIIGSEFKESQGKQKSYARKLRRKEIFVAAPRVIGLRILPVVYVYIFLLSSLTRKFPDTGIWKIQYFYVRFFQTQFSIFTHSVFRSEIGEMFFEYTPEKKEINCKVIEMQSNM